MSTPDIPEEALDDTEFRVYITCCSPKMSSHTFLYKPIKVSVTHKDKIYPRHIQLKLQGKVASSTTDIYDPGTILEVIHALLDAYCEVTGTWYNLKITVM